MKAWMVFAGDPSDGCLLVYADARNEARNTGFRKGPHDWDEYVWTSARRVPGHDQYAVGDKPYVVETNDDLPAGADPFYCDDPSER